MIYDIFIHANEHKLHAVAQLYSIYFGFISHSPLLAQYEQLKWWSALPHGSFEHMLQDALHMTSI